MTLSRQQPARRTLILINNVAARARRAWPVLREKLEAARIAFDAHETICRGDAEAQTRRALQAGYDTVAVVGGDGTLSEAASGFFLFEPDDSLQTSGNEVAHLPRIINSSAALALLPAGTGDDFARGLAGRRAPLDEWLQKLIKHRRGETSTRTVDCLYGTTNDGAHKFICLNAATLGLGAQVAMRVAGQTGSVRRLPGEARFALAAAVALTKWREQTLRIRIDGSKAIECQSNLLAVANGLYAGGGMMLAPGARPDDGLLDVLLTRDFSRPELLRELTRVHRGGHLANSKVSHRQGTQVRIETLEPARAIPVEVDGDVRGFTPVEFRVMPGALRVIY